MASLVANNAYGVLDADITAGSTTITVQAVQGARFPTVTGGFYFWATLVDASNNIEIVKCTAHADATDSFTVVRAQQGTVARAFVAGDRFEMRITKEHFNEKLSTSGGSVSYLFGGSFVTANIVSGGAMSVDDSILDNGTDVVNLNSLNTRASLQIDVAYPIHQAPYAMAFRATDGFWYIIYSQVYNAAVNAPFYGVIGSGPTTEVNGSVITRVPNYVDGVGPLNYAEVILTSDQGEFTAIAYDTNGYIVGTGLAGAGHFGLGNATDLVRWTLCYNGRDASKPWYNHWPTKVVTNNRGLANPDTNQTVWFRSDFGEIWAAGEGATGALGNNATTDVTTWYHSLETGLGVIGGVEQIWAAPNTVNPVAIVRKYDGSFWMVGAGGSGVGGNAVVTNRLVWTQISGLPTNGVVKAAFAGGGIILDFCILFDDGTFWAAGDNNAGSLGDGTVVLKNTYAQRASGIANFWIGPTDYGTGNNTTWLLGNDGVLYTSGYNGYYACLSGNTTQKTTFTAATDVPAGFNLETVWPGSGEGTAFFYQRWRNYSTGEVRIYAVGSAVDGCRGHGAFAAATTNSNITGLIPVHPDDIAWMGCCHTATASRKGYGLLVTNSGDLYATGKVLGSSDNGTTYDTYTSFPHRKAPNGSSIFTKVHLEDYSA